MKYKDWNYVYRYCVICAADQILAVPDTHLSVIVDIEDAINNL